MNHIIIPNSTYLLAFKAAQSHTTSSSLPGLPQTEQEHHSFPVPPHAIVSPVPCSLPPRFCMELLSISQSRCSSVSHCLTEERVIAHWLLHGNRPWIRLRIVQYTLRPLACFGDNLFTYIFPVTQLPGYFWWSICYVISWMKFRWFRPPGSRKKELRVGALTCLPFRLVLFQSLKQGSFMQATC